MKQIYYYYRFSTFYACVPRVSMKLLNWSFQYWHFNWYFIHWRYELLCIKRCCIKRKKFWM